MRRFGGLVLATFTLLVLGAAGPGCDRDDTRSPAAPPSTPTPPPPSPQTPPKAHAPGIVAPTLLQL
jgi:hypothetical protein